jgi:hypothetical protein
MRVERSRKIAGAARYVPPHQPAATRLAAHKSLPQIFERTQPAYSRQRDRNKVARRAERNAERLDGARSTLSLGSMEFVFAAISERNDRARESLLRTHSRDCVGRAFDRRSLRAARLGY